MTKTKLVFAAGALATAVAGSVIVGVFLPHGLAAQVMATAAWLRRLGVLGWAIFIGAEALVAMAGVLPASLLGVAAGAVYGIAAGFCTGAIGVVIGALAAFALSRSMFRPLIAAALGRRARLNALDEMLTGQSWRFVLLLRISPVMPFSLTSYALGLSGVSTKDYLLGTLGSVPALLAYVVIGALGTSTLASTSRDDAAIHAVILVLGAAATLVLTLKITRMLTRALRTA